jgi:hypothetical protein
MSRTGYTDTRMATTTGIVYLLTSNQLAARLVVSLYSLRKFYDGPITVFSTRPESREIGELCARDATLRVDHRQIAERPGRGHVSAYLTKTLTMLESPYDTTVFLDADTLVVGDIDRLVQCAQEHEIVATSFCHWQTTDPHLQRLLDTWRTLRAPDDFPYDIAQLIDLLSRLPFPAINVGVFGVHKQAAILPHWDRLSCAASEMPLPEEIALQILLPRFEHLILSTKFNCHPSICPDLDDIRIWHFAAATHLADEASRRHWLPAYQECKELNIANIRAWSRVVPGPPRANNAARREPGEAEAPAQPDAP